GKVSNSGATTIAHWKLMVDGAVVAEYHDANQQHTVSLDTRTLTDGQHKLQFHGHGLARSGQQLAGQVEVPITVSNGSRPPCSVTDCFDRSDSPSLGGAWNTYAPGIEISSNQARNTDLNSKVSQYLTSVGSEQDGSTDCM